MFCPECHAEYRSGFTHCTDCDVDLIPQLDPHARKPKRDSETYPANNAPKLLSAFIRVGWIPAGMLGLWIGEKLGSGSIKDPADSLLGQHGSFWLFLFCLAAAARPIAVGRNIRNSCARHFRAFLKVRSGIFCRSLVCKEKP
jgi:hypothetical protein